MLNRLIATIISFAAFMAVNAQGICTINGHITDSKLENGKAIKKVYLMRTDEFGRQTEVAEAKVKKGNYTFSYKLAQNEPVMMYTITGFDKNNCIELFIEPGEVTINTLKAIEPGKSKVTGTITNDTYSEYKDILEKYEATDAAGIIKKESERIKFLIEHNASPITPLEMERSVMPYTTEVYAEQMVNSIAMELHSHPYYTSFRNAMLARNLKVGNEIPDIVIPMVNGTSKRITDYRGKYIILDFWASSCQKSMETRETLKELYEIIKDKQDQFVIISLSLDSNADSWKNAIQSEGMNKEGWVNGCDTTGTTIKFFGAENTPRIVFVEPEGRAISLNMSKNDIIERVEQILMGDLYYLDQEK